jgi:hypothetical protein
MRRIEDFMNWLTDKDWTWEPVLSLRPSKDQDIGNRTIFRLAPIFGCIPALIVFLSEAFEHMRPFTVAHIEDARNGPPRAQPKSRTAVPFRFFRQTLKIVCN